MALSPSDRAAMLSVQQLRTFCGVYKHRGYAAAEESLGLAVPTMWEQIKSLERTYGVALFERHGRSVAPTAVAEGLYRLVRPILASLESSFEVVDEHAGHPPDQISIITGVRMMLEELGASLREFHRTYPNVRLRLMHADNQTAQQRVLDEDADLALLLEPPPELARPGLTYERLYSNIALAVLPRRHRLAKQKTVRLADLIGEPLIVGNTHTVSRRLLEHALFREGQLSRIQISVETDNSAAAVACVRAGLGVAIITGKMNGILLKQVVAKSLRDELGRTHIVAAMRKGRERTQLLDDLLKSIQTTNSNQDTDDD